MDCADSGDRESMPELVPPRHGTATRNIDQRKQHRPPAVTDAAGRGRMRNEGSVMICGLESEIGNRKGGLATITCRRTNRRVTKAGNGSVQRGSAERARLQLQLRWMSSDAL